MDTAVHGLEMYVWLVHVGELIWLHRHGNGVHMQPACNSVLAHVHIADLRVSKLVFCVFSTISACPLFHLLVIKELYHPTFVLVRDQRQAIQRL